VYVARPFAGLASECDIVAMRELVPAATAPLTLKADPSREATGRAVTLCTVTLSAVTLCTVLPGAAPAIVSAGGEIRLALQVRHNFGDPARDLGAVLEAALVAEPGPVGLTDPPGAGARLQDLISDGPLAVTVHEGFDFWASGVEDDDERAAMTAMAEQAAGAIHPTVRLTGVEAAYWTNVGAKEHLRWVMPEPEDDLLTALARLHARGDDRLVDGSRFVGMFRAHGLLTPVWDLPAGTGAEALEEPADRFAADLAEALADDVPLTSAERSARAGLANRQVTIR
jgi:hypothetical protein